MNLYRILAFAALALHLAWMAWVVLGWLVTRNRPVLRWLHVASLLYSIVIMISPWPCPLTLAEQWSEARAGLQPYQKSFLEHYLESMVYPDLPPGLLTWCAVSACVLILGIYAWRFRRRAVGRW